MCPNRRGRWRTSALTGWTGCGRSWRTCLSCAPFLSRRATEGELQEILDRGREAEACIRAGLDRTQADLAFHAAIVRATHNEFMMRLLPIIRQAVSAAVRDGGHREQLARDTLRDHALLLEFFRKRDGAGAELAMALHMRRAMEGMELSDGL